MYFLRKEEIRTDNLIREIDLATLPQRRGEVEVSFPVDQNPDNYDWASTQPVGLGIDQ